MKFEVYFYDKDCPFYVTYKGTFKEIVDSILFALRRNYSLYGIDTVLFGPKHDKRDRCWLLSLDYPLIKYYDNRRNKK